MVMILLATLATITDSMQWSMVYATNYLAKSRHDTGSFKKAMKRPRHFLMNEDTSFVP